MDFPIYDMYWHQNIHFLIHWINIAVKNTNRKNCWQTKRQNNWHCRGLKVRWEKCQLRRKVDEKKHWQGQNVKKEKTLTGNVEWKKRWAGQNVENKKSLLLEKRSMEKTPTRTKGRIEKMSIRTKHGMWKISNNLKTHIYYWCRPIIVYIHH